MIRPARRDDIPAIIDLAAATGLVPADASGMLRELLDPFVNGRTDDGTLWLTDHDNDGLVAVAYAGPERLTNGTFNLFMIAVRPDQQGRSRGSAFLTHLESQLADRGARLMIVDTSSQPEFERTRAFYRRNGYVEEARIRDFWNNGDDKIVFWKTLSK